MSLVFAVTVLLVNLVLWILLLTRFRALFDTGDIVDKMQTVVTELNRDLNRAAQRDITLFNECSKQLHVLLDEADKKVVLLKDEEQKAELLIEKLQMSYTKLKASIPDRTAAEGESAISKSGGTKRRAVSSYKKVAPKRAAEKSVSPSSFASGGTRSGVQQQLFEDRESNMNINVPALQGESEYIKKNVGSHIYLSEKKQEESGATDFSAQVMAMKGSGFSTEQIAERLSCSLTEVQMILDMSLV